MNITSNREALKDLANLAVDFQFLQQNGSPLFSYSGESTEQYQALLSTFTAILDDVLAHVESIKERIAPSSNKNDS